MAEKIINAAAALSVAALLSGMILTAWIGFAGLKIASVAVLALALDCLAHCAVKSNIRGTRK